MTCTWCLQPVIIGYLMFAACDGYLVFAAGDGYLVFAAAAGYLHIVVITLCVVFALCAIACLANHWRLTGGGGGGGGGGAGGRSWHLTSCGERQRSSRGGSAGSAAENSRLQPQTSSLCSTDVSGERGGGEGGGEGGEEGERREGEGRRTAGYSRRRARCAAQT